MTTRDRVEASQVRLPCCYPTKNRVDKQRKTFTRTLDLHLTTIQQQELVEVLQSQQQVNRSALVETGIRQNHIRREVPLADGNRCRRLVLGYTFQYQKLHRYGIVRDARGNYCRRRAFNLHPCAADTGYRYADLLTGQSQHLAQPLRDQICLRPAIKKCSRRVQLSVAVFHRNENRR
uniref:(northern house mosquito) hypothetical protein n=1 Tax=Culex pipiens TaxID=7175 RepID=A0A8D8G621_CULPI